LPSCGLFLKQILHPTKCFDPKFFGYNRKLLNYRIK